MNISLFKNLVCPNETIAVALSGGLDSVCLLDALNSFKNELKLILKVINIEHGIRENSKDDTLFCKQLAEKYGLEFSSVSVNALEYSKTNSKSIEESARILRYSAFFDAINSGFCDKIAVAHHGSDDVETVLFNLFRGSGLKGVCGINEKAYDGKIIRPFINLEKSELIAYATEKSLSFVTDQTNFDTAYSRNYIREVICPLISKEFPRYQEAVKRFSKSAKEDDEFLYELAYEAVNFENQYYLSTELKKPIFSRAVIIILNKLGITKDYTKAQIDSVFDLINLQTGKEVSLLKGVTAIKEYNKIVFYFEKNTPKNEQAYFSKGFFKFENKTLEVKQVFERKNGELCFDFEKVPYNAIFRHISEGDRIKKFGGGHKSLNKYLTDKKIPKTKKNELIVLAEQSNILLIVGLEISDTVKIDENTREIVTVNEI